MAGVARIEDGNTTQRQAEAREGAAPTHRERKHWPLSHWEPTLLTTSLLLSGAGREFWRPRPTASRSTAEGSELGCAPARTPGRKKRRLLQRHARGPQGWRCLLEGTWLWEVLDRLVEEALGGCRASRDVRQRQKVVWGAG